MLKKGTMQLVKQYAGVKLLLLGGGLILFKDITIDMLTEYNIIIGVILIGVGYLSLIAGRRQ